MFEGFPKTANSGQVGLFKHSCPLSEFSQRKQTMLALCIVSNNTYMLHSVCRYRKSLDELQKNSDKKIALLTNATKKAEAVVCTLYVSLIPASVIFIRKCNSQNNGSGIPTCTVAEIPSIVPIVPKMTFLRHKGSRLYVQVHRDFS